jgi:hypothetical protein
LAEHGITIDYDEDRAGIDLGYHPTLEAPAAQMARLGTTRVWFQLKGRHATTLSEKELSTIDSVSIELPLEQVRNWYAASEPVYLVFYLEARNHFIASDIQQLIDAKWGEAVLDDAAFAPDQKDITIRVPISAVFDENTVKGLTQHRSMRIDGRSEVVPSATISTRCDPYPPSSIHQCLRAWYGAYWRFTGMRSSDG